MKDSDFQPKTIEGMRAGINICSEFLSLFGNQSGLTGESFADRNNALVNAVASVYLRKTISYGEACLAAIKNDDLLIAATTARSLFETTASTRFFLKEEIAPAISAKPLTHPKILFVLKLLHGEITSGRFDWEQFELHLSSGNLAHHLESRKSKSKSYLKANRLFEREASKQILTSLQHWAKTEPYVELCYGMLSDMVHPNFGANILLSSVEADTLTFGQAEISKDGSLAVSRCLSLLFVLCTKEIRDNILILENLRVAEGTFPDLIFEEGSLLQ